MPACLARQSWAEGTVWGLEEHELHTLCERREEVNLEMEGMFGRAFLSLVCQEALDFFWALGQGCIPRWDII